ncbi:MAG TPA: iron-containing alcohol dehydrogenase [Geminicoccus sp.]|jgi:alcohol dehydrogenase class IV|uniref:iron-containing alcohol dehydrogenase n=1 Tax=Geminicoccus sp. TaxID=2024832 RepID=UPI002E2F0D12|nr:iron-containing alcohol dehydrogenase [Geminicoccus sp.]HEX2528827.1 iron-containing alcohol dehydrogenase [Geminicoccus sp.]
MNSFSFHTTPSIRFGAGTITELGRIVTDRGWHRITLVTDKGIVQAGLIEQPLALLHQAGVEVTLFDEVTADPPEPVVYRAATLAAEAQAQAVVGLGGGSSLDVAKLVALLLGTSQDLRSAYGVGNAKGPRLPLLLIPTTAGTGAEVTPIAIITTGLHEKMGVVSPVILPDIALLDPELTLGLPAPVTAATGIDAMVHAIEAYTSVSANNNPISRGLARQALQLLGSNIHRAVHEGRDLEARSAMLLGSMLAGQAFTNSPVAAVHALAYPLGGHYGVPHGLSNALVLPHVLRFNMEACADSYAELAPLVFPDIGPGEGREGAVRFIEALATLSHSVGLVQRLRDVGIEQDAIPMLAAEALKQQRLLVNNPVPVELADAAAIYRAAW